MAGTLSSLIYSSYLSLKRKEGEGHSTWSGIKGQSFLFYPRLQFQEARFVLAAGRPMPAKKDVIVMDAMSLVLNEVFEKSFLECYHGF